MLRGGEWRAREHAWVRASSSHLPQPPLPQKRNIMVLIDDVKSNILLSNTRIVERILLEGTPVDEGEATLEEVVQSLLEKAKKLAKGTVFAVFYTDSDEEIRLAAKGNWLAVSVESENTRLAGSEAFKLFRNAHGEYQVVLHEYNL